MSKTDRVLDEKNKTIRWLTIIIALLVFLVVHAHIQVMNMPKEWSFWTPPNIDAGGKSKIGEVPDVEAFNFAFMIFGNINTWINDGATEYPTNLSRYRFYASESYLGRLKSEFTNNQASYRNRRRSVSFVLKEDGTPDFKPRRVGKNGFEIEAVLRVKDVISGSVIFDEERRYFFTVKPFNVSRQYNPWQLRIMGEYQRYVLEKKHV